MMETMKDMKKRADGISSNIGTGTERYGYVMIYADNALDAEGQKVYRRDTGIVITKEEMAEYTERGINLLKLDEEDRFL